MNSMGAPVRHVVGHGAVVPVLSDEEAPRLRLEFLDGLRGLAALYVVEYHISQFAPSPHASPWRHAQQLYWHFFCYGHQAVVVFIVLSGYVLMLPVARTQDGHMPKGVWDYFKRRARRILPPYYAALSFSILLLALYPSLQHPALVSPWGVALPPFVPLGTLTHILLIHNLTPHGYKIDPPMWSVALEWQIYFLFPFLFLPLWRRFGLLGPVVGASVLSLGILHQGLFPVYAWTAPWMLVAFTLGMAGAAVNFWEADPFCRSLRDKLPWYRLGFISLLLVPIAHFLTDHRFFRSARDGDWLTNILMALAAMCFIVGSTRFLQKEHRLNRLFRWLDAPPTVKLGTFSYSLYLVHYPILGALFWGYFGLSHSQRAAWIVVFCSVPVIVGVAYLFHLVFERPFMPTHLRKGQARSLEKMATSTDAATPAPHEPALHVPPKQES
ncbi:MAG TPA: acyltransferase [Chthonomonas sp.]|uniref:acyltransferase family protein n=1 Tax=Chthonomonas sp. TaxID=2282153 RepID=UPI002B4B77A4|nr:acyltransferase [Chthonomonas sp.]HLH80511.1 acyltransferase [Chthonomonas sp.]